MRPFRSSLLGRIAFGFTVTYVCIAFVLILFIEVFAYELDPYRGADAVATRLSAKIQFQSGGKILLPADPVIANIAKTNPDMWFVIQAGEHKKVFGEVPPLTLAIMRQIDSSKMADLIVNIPLQRPGQVDYAAIVDFETLGGEVLVAVGGVDPRSIGLQVALMRWSVTTSFLVAILLALASLVIVSLVTAIALRAVRPLTASIKELDAEDLSARLSVPGLIRELQPAVTAFNLTLTRLETLTKLRRRFMADVAHEFRTPLAVLTFHAENLAESSTKADIERGLFRLSQMIGQMLDSERLKSSRPSIEVLNLVELSKSTLADIAPFAVDAGYELALICNSDRVEISGDEMAIRRAIMNLISNAIAHAGGQGVISVTVSQAGWVQVSDEGPGLPADVGEQVFEPFYRERWDQDGCGLGLHLVREIMNAHGGKAEFIKGDGGATFRLTFSRGRTESPAYS
jgi:signal transduction histidine kinase